MIKKNMKKIRRILALTGVILLAALYLVTLLCAIFDTDSSMFFFRASVMCTILIPILLWGYTVIYRLAKGKNEQELEEALQHLDSGQEKKQNQK